MHTPIHHTTRQHQEYQRRSLDASQLRKQREHAHKPYVTEGTTIIVRKPKKRYGLWALWPFKK